LIDTHEHALIPDTCVTVVDASAFSGHLSCVQRLKDTSLGDGADTAEGEGLICQLLVSQIEYADVVVLNKRDLVEESQMKEVRRAVQGLNCRARVLECEFGKVSSDVRVVYVLLGQLEFMATKSVNSADCTFSLCTFLSLTSHRKSS
jgi:G3E family GTPase